MYIFLKPIISDFPTVLFPFPLLRFNENECFSHRKPTALCRWACSDHAWNFFSLDRKKRLKSKRPMCKGQPRKGPERPPRDWRTGQGRAVPGQRGAGCGGGSGEQGPGAEVQETNRSVQDSGRDVPGCHGPSPGPDDRPGGFPAVAQETGQGPVARPPARSSDSSFHWRSPPSSKPRASPDLLCPRHFTRNRHHGGRSHCPLLPDGAQRPERRALSDGGGGRSASVIITCPSDK